MLQTLLTNDIYAEILQKYVLLSNNKYYFCLICRKPHIYTLQLLKGWISWYFESDSWTFARNFQVFWLWSLSQKNRRFTAVFLRLTAVSLTLFLSDTHVRSFSAVIAKVTKYANHRNDIRTRQTLICKAKSAKFKLKYLINKMNEQIYLNEVTWFHWCRIKVVLDNELL